MPDLIFEQVRWLFDFREELQNRGMDKQEADEIIKSMYFRNDYFGGEVNTENDIERVARLADGDVHFGRTHKTSQCTGW